MDGLLVLSTTLHDINPISFIVLMSYSIHLASIKEESYLSLLMLHSDYKYIGLGSEVYEGLEQFAKAHDSDQIRIDVVTSYDRGVLDFWGSKGFNIIDMVELN